jgi:threonyl-tRNA synthetase
VQFHQDDAHIFCTKEQIESEIKACLAFVDRIYSAFGLVLVSKGNRRFTVDICLPSKGFEYTMNLSTRPEKFMGELETWNEAEASLRRALDETGLPWVLNPGGASI